MIDHVGLGVRHIARAVGFYDRALAPLGIRRVMSFGGTEDAPQEVGYGTDHPAFWLARGARASGPLHIAFAAPDRAAVDAFHRAALEAGGRGNGAPGLRAQYHPT